MLSSTQRFSERVENYVKYRPGYPQGVIDTLRRECGLAPEHVVADVGSGTGILTALLLKHGNAVYAVEPNAAMRTAAESQLGSNAQFSSINGTAEASGLPPESVDFVAAGQAFHWFEPVATRREFQRILRVDGWVALVWNRRPAVSDAFQDAYENLLRLHSPEYAVVSHERIDAAALARFFAPSTYSARHFSNFQEFDLESLRGRLLSSSYAPLPGQPGHDALMTGLEEIFAEHNEKGRVRFEYDTELSFGHLV